MKGVSLTGVLLDFETDVDKMHFPVTVKHHPSIFLFSQKYDKTIIYSKEIYNLLLLLWKLLLVLSRH